MASIADQVYGAGMALLKLEARRMPPWTGTDEGEVILLNPLIVASVVSGATEAGRAWSHVSLVAPNTVWLARSGDRPSEFWVKASPERIAELLAAAAGYVERASSGAEEATEARQ